MIIHPFVWNYRRWSQVFVACAIQLLLVQYLYMWRVHEDLIRLARGFQKPLYTFLLGGATVYQLDKLSISRDAIWHYITYTIARLWQTRLFEINFWSYNRTSYECLLWTIRRKLAVEYCAVCVFWVVHLSRACLLLTCDIVVFCTSPVEFVDVIFQWFMDTPEKRMIEP